MSMMIQGAQTQTNQQVVVCVPGNRNPLPVRSLKVLGGIQIVLGILLVLLSIIGVGIDIRYHGSLVFDILCLVCSGWFIMTGMLPMCMSKKREKSWTGLRIGFMVCSIIGAVVFSPAMFPLILLGALFRFSDTTLLWIPMAILSFIEFVVAIVASSFCCCCTPWQNQQQTEQCYSA